MAVFGIALAVLAVLTASVSADDSPRPPIPSGILGDVFYENGSACYNPDITITNLNTDETFSTVTWSNHYFTKPMPSLEDISESDVLRVEVSAGPESVVIDHRITESDMLNHELFMDITFGKNEIAEQISTPPLSSQASPSPAITSTPEVTIPIPTAEQTLIPTAEQTLIPTAEQTVTPTPVPEEEKRGIPGFEASFAIVGLLVIHFLSKKVGVEKGKK